MASHTPGSIFEEARERVSREVDSIVSCLHQKRDRMLEEIGGLERESEGRQREKQKDIGKLNTLIAHTEELGQNSLLRLRQKVIGEMQQEMQKLKIDSKQKPDYSIHIKWGSNKKSLFRNINRSKIELFTEITAEEPDCLVLSDGTESSEDLNTELSMLPEGVNNRSYCRTPPAFRDPILPRRDTFQNHGRPTSRGFEQRPSRGFGERPFRGFEERPSRGFEERRSGGYREPRTPRSAPGGGFGRSGAPHRGDEEGTRPPQRSRGMGRRRYE